MKRGIRLIGRLFLLPAQRTMCLMAHLVMMFVVADRMMVVMDRMMHIGESAQRRKGGQTGHQNQ